MTDRTITKEEYRFNEEEHLHEILIDGVWVAMTGVSSVVKDMVNYGVAAYYGSRRALMALGYDPKDAPDELKEVRATVNKMNIMLDEDLKGFLKSAYTNHATYSKARATKGTNSHDIVDKYIKKCLKENKGEIMETKEPIVQKFLDLTKDFLPYKFLASEKHGHNRDYFIAGITDVIVETEKFGIGIWDLKDRPAIYGKDLLQCGGYTLLYPYQFQHVLGIPLEGKEVRTYYDIDGLQRAFINQLGVYRAMQELDPIKKYK